MITATVKHNDNYADIEFPCSEAYLSAKLMEIHVDDLSSITHYISAITEPKELSFLKDKMINLDELNYLAKRMDKRYIEARLDVLLRPVFEMTELTETEQTGPTISL